MSKKRKEGEEPPAPVYIRDADVYFVNKKGRLIHAGKTPLLHLDMFKGVEKFVLKKNGYEDTAPEPCKIKKKKSVCTFVMHPVPDRSGGFFTGLLILILFGIFQKKKGRK